MDLLSKIKTHIRIRHTVLDDDVQDTIDACIQDLRTVGILESKLDTSGEEMDPLILQAIKMKCKAEYSEDPAKAARYQAGYDNMKACLMMAEGYGWEDVVDE